MHRSHSCLVTTCIANYSAYHYTPDLIHLDVLHVGLTRKLRIWWELIVLVAPCLGDWAPCVLYFNTFDKPCFIVAMPFLRRRGNMASESDMRRQSTLVDRSLLQEDREHFDERPDTDAATHHDVATPPTATSSSLLEPSRSFDQETNPRPSSHEIPRPGTPPVQDETPKHRRFSILRFRNASDSQLSLRARQQADNVPPVPKRKSGFSSSPHAKHVCSKWR